MTAENTMQWMMDFYPDFYPTRKHCLNHLFCVVGNGYKWVNGQLVDEDDLFAARYKMVKSVKRAVGPKEELWCMHAQLEKAKQLASSGSEKYEPNYEFLFRWATPSKLYSKLYNHPANITPDWLAAIEECKALLIADGIEV